MANLVRFATTNRVGRRSAAWGFALVLGSLACDETQLIPSAATKGRAAAPWRQAGVAPPNIVLVSIDSLRPDHLGSYGYGKPTSPTIDRLASEGVRFASAVSTTSWTLPSHAALFTGLADSAHGLVDNGLRLAEQHVTLAEALGAAGYATAGFFGGPYLHPTFGLAQGFETYHSCMTGVGVDLSDGKIREQARAEHGPSHGDITGPRTREEVARWADTRASGTDRRPFFLFLHLWDVHFDYLPPPRYAKLFDPDYRGTLDGRDVMHDPRIHRGMSRRDLEHLEALYDGEIRFTDDILGEILAALDARGMLDDTVIVVTADHGEEFFEHGSRGHAQTLFDEVLRVPLIVHWRGTIAGGQVVETQVGLIDLMPTLLAIAGAPPREAIMGRDLSPLLRAEVIEEEPRLSELHLDYNGLVALRTNESKLASLGGERFLHFDLEADSGEQHPLPNRGRAFDAARVALQERVAEARSIAEGRRHPGAVRFEVEPEMRERLESLGYIDAR